MPAITNCLRCGFSGPHGFSDGAPWGRSFYHSGCRGFWVGSNGKRYRNEAGAYRAWKQKNPTEPEWEKAYDALILRGDQKGYERHIKEWGALHGV